MLLELAILSLVHEPTLPSGHLFIAPLRWLYCEAIELRKRQQTKNPVRDLAPICDVAINRS